MGNGGEQELGVFWCVGQEKRQRQAGRHCWHCTEGWRALVIRTGHAVEKWDAIIWHDGWVKSWNGDLEKGLK